VAIAVPPQQAPYRASGFVHWPKADIWAALMNVGFRM
jgi:hypothetical protein